MDRTDIRMQPSYAQDLGTGGIEVRPFVLIRKPVPDADLLYLSSSSHAARFLRIHDERPGCYHR